MIKIVDFVDEVFKEYWTEDEFRMLDRWTIFNHRALSRAHLRCRLEEFTNVTTLHLCNLITDGCDKKLTGTEK